MSRNLHESTPERGIAANRFGVKDLRQKPLAFAWWQPDCLSLVEPGDEEYSTTGCSEQMEFVELQNDFAQPTNDSGLEKFAFRLHADGSLEFKGHLDTSQGAVTGTVAVTLPGSNLNNPPEPDFRPANDQFWHTTITEDDGSSFTLALVKIEALTGDVYLFWPAT